MDLTSDFRSAMAAVATPVSVVTTAVDGVPHGTTVSAFASLSMDPPMLLVALDRKSELLTLVTRTRRFGVNILSHGGADWALAFAGKGGEAKFDGVPWTFDNGLPRIADATFVECTVTDLIDGGDHVVVFGRVAAAEVSVSPPLTYHQRVFGTHTAVVSQ